MDNKEHKNLVVSSFQNDLKTRDIAREESNVKDETSPFPFSHKQELHTHVFQDPFTRVFEASVKADFVVAMDFGCQCQLELEFSPFKFFFLFHENERRKWSCSHFLVWLH